MSVALRGSLRDFGIGEVFQLIGQQRKTGVLSVEDGSERILISFENGNVVGAESAGPYEGAALGDMLIRVGLLTPDHLVEIERALGTDGQNFAAQVEQHTDLTAPEVAEIADLVARDTIFALLRWSQGSFYFTAQPVASRSDPRRHLPAEQILMDGLRMVDEWRAMDGVVTDAEAIFQRVGRFETYRAAQADDPPEKLASAERLFLLIDGRLPVRRVIDLSRMGTFEGARVLSQLRRIGVIEPLGEEALARRRSRRAPAETGPRASRAGVAATLLSFAFLLAMAILAGRPQPEVPAPPHALARDRAREARVAFETLRLRNWIEAYHFAEGRWPAELSSLSDLPGDAAFPVGPLAASQDPPYYYARRGEAFSLLAPEY